MFFSILGNLSILGFFKYFNFFAANLQALLYSTGISLHPVFLSIILPVGISFYTFQTMSYTIDIYRHKMEPTRKFFDFALFVAFFPQLVAGPIERARHLLPQILYSRKVTLDNFYEGCYLIFWGLFMKIFVADNLARIVDPVFASQGPYNGVRVLLALYSFAFQIFCDFAGYSNIARGLGRVMGFDIMVNFNLPYFAKNPSDFWKRWHISFSSWLRDYLYIPLGGNRKGSFFTYRNLAITMLLGGLWHGAAWTFILWGVYQGILLIGHRSMQPLLKKIPTPKSVFWKRVWLMAQIMFFFHLMCLGWLIFRAQSTSQICSMLHSLFVNFLIPIDFSRQVFSLLYFVSFLIAIQIVQYFRNDLLFIMKERLHVKMAFVVIIVCLSFYVIIFGKNSSIGGGSEFIYFQF